jgi:uncharacterized protein YabE (DUF348 family)
MALRDQTWKRNQDAHPGRGQGSLGGLLAAPVFFLLAALLVLGYQRSLLTVNLSVDGTARIVRTHQTTVEAVTREAGLTLYPEDLVSPPLSAQIAAGDDITIHRAQLVHVAVDGRTVEGRTQLSEPKAILAQLGIELSEHDQVRLATMDSPGRVMPMLQLQVDRAVPVTVQETGSLPLHYFTTGKSVGEALHDAGILIYLADDVRPSFDSPIKPGTLISVKRSIPVTIVVDGQTFRTRTHRHTVGDVLADAGISLNGMDYAMPDLATPLGDGQEIRVVRVQEEVLVQQEHLAYETQWAPNPELELDHQQVAQEGQIGVYERRVRVRYEDGAEVDRWVEAEWVAKAPVPKIFNYGTKIVLRTIDTPSGPVQYWRKYRMLATSYNAASSGKSPDHPRYGITRLGWKMRFGIVAVDPAVISLGSQVFVPGYGVGDAADTGGAIRNMRIDLGYDDDNLVSWYRCVDVYLLAPVPSNVEYVVSTLSHPWCR